MNRFRSLAICVLLISGTGCSDMGGPNRGAGVYRLVSVNGQPLPIYYSPSLGLGPVLRGDLYLRWNHTYGLGLEYFIREGAWLLDDSTLKLTRGEGSEITAHLDGDSVAISFGTSPSVFVFKRDGASREGLQGTYIMTDLLGRSDLAYEYENFEGYTEQIAYDSIHFVDDVFFRRHRKEVSFTVDESNDTTPGGEHDFVVHGSYQRRGSALQLYTYPPLTGVRGVDSLTVVSGKLVRSRMITIDPGESIEWRETYSRIR